MVLTLDYGKRRARKVYRCGMCGALIHPGDLHSFSNNVYDGSAYTWRECMACARDTVCNYVHAFTGGWHDEGVDYEAAVEWAMYAIDWPKRWPESWRPEAHPISTHERMAARNWMARAAGDE